MGGILKEEDSYRLLAIFPLVYLSVGFILGRIRNSIKNYNLELNKEYRIVRPKAREYPRLNSLLTKKSLLQENPTILLGKLAILLDSISKRYITKKGLVIII